MARDSRDNKQLHGSEGHGSEGFAISGVFLENKPPLLG